LLLLLLLLVLVQGVVPAGVVERATKAVHSVQLRARYEAAVAGVCVGGGGAGGVRGCCSRWGGGGGLGPLEREG
jgi:hypothetical protein